MSDSILSQHVVSIMSYNIRTAVAQQGHEWVDRAPMVSQIIARNATDLIGLQEVQEHQLHDLLPSLAEYDWFGQGRDGGPTGEFGPVCFRRSRFEQLDAGEFWLSDTPEVAGSNTWPSLYPRFVTWVRLRERITGDELVFANTHLDHDSSPHGDDVRSRSAALIVERFSEIDVPIILTGDFNTVGGSTTHDTFEQAGFLDLSDGASDGVGTFHDYGPQHDGTLRIDWVLARAGSAPRRASVATIEATVDDHSPAPEASDHFPIVVRAQLVA
ncbi:MAG TPA: endonuclease/exonuclease/phosphatase family protein [Plantibacter sp.]|uniref:endonuclease/exonuclease/phosphatase family protein n=1 Tax=unclassified Plantibacter TaxID=2624265 RepID=UPI002C28AB1F|nr:endonuclease/exonuclease/phosphatase family protein [Plantibacter sp.]